MHIDNKLKFHTQISNSCQKASRQLNVLFRIGKHLNRLCKLTIYYPFILSNFNFCPLSWHFCSKANTNKIEKIQERSLRFIYENYSLPYEELLKISKMPTLQIRRLRTMAIETFKIINKDSPSYLHDLITVKESTYSFRYSNQATIPSVKTTKYGINSFRYSAAKLWNSLPNHFKDTTSFNQFKSLMNSWNDDQCRCSVCST